MKQFSFLLCPDRSAARRVRRLVASKAPDTDVVVGTWPELVQHARDAYLLGTIEEAWSAALAQAASSITEAFWAKSLVLAMPETLGILDRTLTQLLTAAGPGKQLEVPAVCALSARGAQHLVDLERLHGAMDRQLPQELLLIGTLLEADPQQTLRTITVFALPGLPQLNPWQQALVEKLNRYTVGVTKPHLQTLLTEGCRPPVSADRPTDLAFLQNHLYTTPEKPAIPGGSIQWLAVRDYMQEAEVAAGMIQHALAEQSDLVPADIGLLLPDDPRYALAIREVFSRTGLPLAGLVETHEVRDLGRELVFYLLLSLKKPAPAMAFAALLASPLLPWGRTQGLLLAQAVMDGNYPLEKMAWPSSGKALLKALVTGVDKPAGVLNVLEGIEAYLPDDETLADAVSQARNLANELRERLLGGSSIAWDEMIALAAPAGSTRIVEGEVTLEGVAVFQESQEIWRPVRHLFVLGFNNGHYPQAVGFSPVSSEADLERFKTHSPFAVETSADISCQRRQRFQRQLGYASERINFLVSRRDSFGKGLVPSTSLTFMAKLFGAAEPEELILELDTEAGRKQAVGLALAVPGKPVPPRNMQIDDLELHCDLLALHKLEDGTLYPMSPSRLETLMVSPLAWVLGRSDLDPRQWAPEELDVASKGTLAHAVFEWLFPFGADLPDEAAIRAQVPGLLNRAIISIKPFLLGAEWQVERNHLENETLVAAIRWREILLELNARILGVEVWLNGFLDGIPLHGSADMLLGLPDGRLYVVDYKKSKSKKRKERMQAAFDSQASLYRIMLETGGVSSRKSADVDQSVKQATEIGVLYYLMNDQVALTDTNGWLDAGLDGVEELAGDVSSEAIKLIRQRLAEVKHGQVRLNTEDDEKWFDKNAGLKLYALENSPLIRLFMHPSSPTSC
ncbi:MAG: PD-(D/E)XK nuclease family protein [Desulfuromonadales bacterium]